MADPKLRKLNLLQGIQKDNPRLHDLLRSMVDDTDTITQTITRNVGGGGGGNTTIINNPIDIYYSQSIASLRI